MKIKVLKQLQSQKGLTLVEVMVAAVVFVLAFVGVMMTYTKCMNFNELAKNSSTALYGARMKMEEIRNTDFGQIAITYHETSFDIAGLNGKGVSYVETVTGTTDALQIIVTISWIQPNGLMIGEDLNLNGQLDAGEDIDNDGRLSSDTVQLVSIVYAE